MACKLDATREVVSDTAKSLKPTDARLTREEQTYVVGIVLLYGLTAGIIGDRRPESGICLACPLSFPGCSAFAHRQLIANGPDIAQAHLAR